MRRAPKRKTTLPADWSVYASRNRKRSSISGGIPAWAYAATGLGLGAILGVGVFFWPIGGAAVSADQPTTVSNAHVERSFSLCATGGGTNCVVDGDTLWLDGVKIRLADIDAPETHPPRCAREADLGSRATQRLLALVNAGPIEIAPAGQRDEDRYGRKLRILKRGGMPLGDVLVAEGLARRWDGARRPWCP